MLTKMRLEDTRYQIRIEHAITEVFVRDISKKDSLFMYYICCSIGKPDWRNTDRLPIDRLCMHAHCLVNYLIVLRNLLA